MQNIVLENPSNINFSAFFSAEDITVELQKLECEVAVQQDELRSLERGHKARPYRPEFMASMRRSYRSSLSELHSQIDTVRFYLTQKQATTT